MFHALTGSAPTSRRWWGPLVGPGLPLDTTRHAILARQPASAAATARPAPFPGRRPTGAGSPASRRSTWPAAHAPLLAELGVRRLSLATGGSLGGMVALQWGRISPVPVDRLVVFAAPAACSAQAIAWNAAQRMAIEADPGWRGSVPRRRGPHGRPGGGARHRDDHLPLGRGVRRARFGRASYPGRGPLRRGALPPAPGDKLVARFDADSYLRSCDAMDLHDVGDPAAAARATAERVGEIVGVGVDTDILYFPAEVRDWVAAYRRAGANARYAEIASLYGHDAFLIEWEQVGAILRGLRSERRMRVRGLR